MASVNRVYTALKDLVNKDQRGFVTPAVFNSFASVAQMNIYNKLFEDTVFNKRLRNAQIDDRRNLSRRKQTLEDLSVFVKRQQITLINGSGIRQNGLPEDFSRSISATVINNDPLPYVPQTQVHLVTNEEEINYVLSSTLSAPSDDFPVGMITAEGGIREIFIWPQSVTSIYLTYYKVPQGLDTEGYRVASQPRFGYTVVAGKEIYSATNSIDFELPEHYFADLVVEMAKLIGVNLRDQDVYTYGKSEEQN